MFKRNEDGEEKGLIGKFEEEGNPVIVRFAEEMPANSVVSKLPWFTVISWKYDGSLRNGMPDETINKKMMALEDALISKFEKNEICHHAFNRTGNSLKEFNYYISDREEFMRQLNAALSSHETYPIEITFYKDPEWVEMKNLLKEFKNSD